MNREVWEISPSQSRHILRVLSFLREAACPYIGRPTVHVYENDTNNLDTRRSFLLPHRLIVSYTKETKYKYTTLNEYLKLECARHREVKLALAYQLVQTVAFLHSCGVAHQFLSSDTIAVIYEKENKPRISVTNFGDCTTSGKCSSSYICVRNYRPPEVVMQLGGTDPCRVDSWALGCLLFEIFTESVAFSVEAQSGNFRPQLMKTQLEDVVRGIGQLNEDDIPSECPPRVSQYLLGLTHNASIYSRMQEKNPTDEEEANRWISLVKPLLRFNFHTRACAKELIQHALFTGLPPPENWSTSYTSASCLQELME